MRTILPIALGLVIASCGAAGQGAGSTVTSTTTIAATATTGPIPSATEGIVPTEQDQVSAAIADLAQHLKVDPASIELVEVRAVQWPDGSLGCPQDDEQYPQAVVDGSQVILQVEGRVYDYRGDDMANMKLCPSDEKDGGYDFVPPPGFDEK